MHLRSPASPWVRRFASLVPEGGTVLDLACGGGRHTRLFLELGHPVVAADREVDNLSDLIGHPKLQIVQVDLEDGSAFPFAGRQFAGVVVTNYLYRPILPRIVGAVAPDGALIYETFARGNEPFEGPSNPDFLLRPGELLDVVASKLRVVAYEDLIVEDPRPAALQRIAAVNAEPVSRP